MFTKEARFRILVVDDSRDGANMLAMLLRSWGYDVEVAYDGAAGIQIAKAYRPHCILSDVEMPGVDGYGLAAAIREDDSFKSTSLVAITGVNDESKARAAGFDHHFVKPPDHRILESLLRSLKMMGDQLKDVDAKVKQQGEVVSEVRDLMREVKEDVKDIKEGLTEEVKELKYGLQEVREDVKGDQRGTARRQEAERVIGRHTSASMDCSWQQRVNQDGRETSTDVAAIFMIDVHVKRAIL